MKILFSTCIYFAIFSSYCGIAAAQMSNHEAAQGLRELYFELQSFRYTTHFHSVGFGRCCEYSQWRDQVEYVDGQVDRRQFYAEFGFSPRELISIGLVYTLNLGVDDDISAYSDEQIRQGLGID
ncbi:MAG: hypothetical protein KDA64_08975 [Rhodospirillaceae bacterium]|nr:hypothetical protein [Rhodospirillaceae bacterium]